MDQVVFYYGHRNVRWKKAVSELQYSCYRFLNYNTSNTSFNICCCLLSVFILD